jgi:hypothetical protein
MRGGQIVSFILGAVGASGFKFLNAHNMEVLNFKTVICLLWQNRRGNHLKRRCKSDVQYGIEKG